MKTVWLALMYLTATVQAGDWQQLKSPVDTELRGLSVVSDDVVWASGARNTIVQTRDGINWRALNAPAGQYDFRDIEAFDGDHAIVMSAGPAAASTVWQTRDAGANWQLLRQNLDEKGFWDAIAFWDKQTGFIFGDPVDGRFQIWLTRDGGQSWQLTPAAGMPVALDGEGAFAASGTCAVTGNNGRIAFVTGSAARARAFVSFNFGQQFHVADLPIPVTAPSQGGFAITWLNDHTLLAVGGDYKAPNANGINAAISDDGGKTWRAVSSWPNGFLSSVETKQNHIAVSGLAGTLLTTRESPASFFSTAPFNVVKFGDKWVYAAGPKGSLARTVIEAK